MNRSTSTRRIAAVALGLAALAAVSAAQARTDVSLSIGFPVQGVVVQPQPVYVPAPQPVYVPPQPVYVEPRPVYVQPRPVYVQPQPVYVQPPVVYGYGRRGPWGDRDGDGVPNAYDRWDNRQWGHGHRHGPWGDRDGDGVPNRYDRHPGQPLRR